MFDIVPSATLPLADSGPEPVVLYSTVEIRVSLRLRACARARWRDVRMIVQLRCVWDPAVPAQIAGLTLSAGAEAHRVDDQTKYIWRPARVR